MNWLFDDCKNITNKKPYFWIAEARMDVIREKRSKKKRDKILDFRSVVITLVVVGIVILFQDLHREEKKYKLSNLKNAYEDFEEIETRAVMAAVILRFNIGSFPLEEKYNSNNMGTDMLFVDNLFLALDTKNRKRVEIALEQYNNSIYGEISRFGAINKKLSEQTMNINKIAKNIGNKDSLAIADNTMFIHSIFGSHLGKLQEILNLQRKILEIIKNGEINKKEDELSITQEQIKEYYIDLEWQTEKIADAHNKISELFSNLEIE